MFENRVLRKIFGPNRVEVTREWKRLHNEELHDLVLLRKYFTDDQIRENAFDETCGVCEGKEECVQSFIGET